MDALISLIEETATREKFSGVVSVECGGRQYERAFGWMDRTLELANTASTRFGIASGTKFLTALGIGRLIDQGTLELDASLVDCIGVALPGVARAVTIDHLLTHTSGVYDYLDEELIDDFDAFELPIAPFKLRRLHDYLPMLFAGPRKFEPGHRFAYSNGGYILLGLVIEHVSGSSFQEFIQQECFGPSGMADSGFFAFDQLPSGVAHGYVELPDGAHRTNIYTLPVVGGADGGAYCTAADVRQLWQHFHAGRLLSPELTQTFQSSIDTDAGPTRYGRGLWICRDDADHPYCYIEGADAGVSFQSARIAEGTGYVLLSNTSHGVWPLSRLIRVELAREVREGVDESIGRREPTAPSPPPGTPPAREADRDRDRA